MKEFGNRDDFELLFKIFLQSLREKKNSLILKILKISEKTNSRPFVDCCTQNDVIIVDNSKMRLGIKNFKQKFLSFTVQLICICKCFRFGSHLNDVSKRLKLCRKSLLPVLNFTYHFYQLLCYLKPNFKR